MDSEPRDSAIPGQNPILAINRLFRQSPVRHSRKIQYNRRKKHDYQYSCATQTPTLWNDPRHTPTRPTPVLTDPPRPQTPPMTTTVSSALFHYPSTTNRSPGPYQYRPIPRPHPSNPDCRFCYSNTLAETPGPTQSLVPRL